MARHYQAIARRGRRCWPAFGVAGAVFVLSFAAALDKPPTGETLPEVASDHSGSFSSGDANRGKKKGTVTAAVLVLLGIMAIGGLLIVTTIFWGMRLRRLARSRSGEKTNVDSLWYLKKKHDRTRPGASDATKTSRDDTEAPEA
jgi:hypothetical protein